MFTCEVNQVIDHLRLSVTSNPVSALVTTATKPLNKVPLSPHGAGLALCRTDGSQQ